MTLNVDAKGALPLRYLTGVDLPSGVLISGSLYQATIRGAEWLLHSFNSAIYSIPIGGMMGFIGTTAPNSAFVFPTGQAISRTTYATLFSLVGTAYGVGDGSTTFNVPDLTGRIEVMKEATATRLTTAGSGVDGGTLGATGGTQNITLLTANLPAYTPAGSLSVTSTVSNIGRGTNTGDFTLAAGTGGSIISAFANGTRADSAITSTGTLTGTAQGGTSTAVKIVQPTIVLNKLLRII